MAREPVVAVCTNRSPADVADSLAALGAQVPADRLAVVTSGLDSAAAEAHGDAAPGPVLEESRSGLSLARNRALRWARETGAEVVAYVDDDAIVGPGWWQALVNAWARVPDDVAVIGGRILPRWAAPPPAWISPAIMPTLTVLDLGDEPRDLDPRETTVFGANISFATGALDAIGGFDPAYGHSGRRVFFSEEDQAQRLLAERGFRIRYDPTLVVDHVIPAARLKRSAFIRRRFAYGRALGMRGGRSASVAARQLGRSAPGALVASLRPDGRLAMERAVRAVENAGVLVGSARRR